MALQKSHKISGPDITKVFKVGRPIVSQHLSVRVVGGIGKRIAITISPSVAPKAVTRNRVKRLISEAIQGVIPNLKSGCSVVVGVRKVPLPEVQELRHELLFLFGKFDILI